MAHGQQGWACCVQQHTLPAANSSAATFTAPPSHTAHMNSAHDSPSTPPAHRWPVGPYGWEMSHRNSSSGALLSMVSCRTRSTWRQRQGLRRREGCLSHNAGGSSKWRRREPAQ